MLGFLLFSSGVAGGTKEGLWHGFDKEKKETLFYLLITEDGAIAYDFGWNSARLSQFELQGESVEFVLPLRGAGFHTRGEFHDGTLSGTWEIPHPQFSYSGSWEAVHIHNDPDWRAESLVETETANQFREISQLLEEVTDVSDYDEFRRLWMERFESKYYPILTKTVYGGGVTPTRESCESARRAIFERIQEFGDELPALTSRLAEELDQDRRLLSEKAAWIQSDKPIIGSFSLGEFDYRVIELPTPLKRTKQVTVVGLDWLVLNAREKSSSQSQLLEPIIYAHHSAVANLTESIGNELLRRGVSAYTAVRIRGREEDFCREEMGLQEERKELFEQVARPAEEIRKKLLEPSWRDIFYCFAVRAALLFMEDDSLESLFRIEVPAMLSSVREVLAEPCEACEKL